MSIREDIAAYLSDYRGILGWTGYTEVFSSAVIPTIEIPLYVKESPIPTRRQKLTEISTLQTMDPGTQMETTTQIIFFGAPDILQVEISGWTITPTSNSVWAPVDASGSALGWGSISYNDIITYFIKGRLNRNAVGTWQRRDPDYYISPRGQRYNNVTVATYQPTAAPVQKKQPFDMTLFLEQ